MQSVTEDIHFTAGYADPAPWPELAVSRPDRGWAALLAEDYAGAGGEMTASLQYIYHHTVTAGYPDVSEALEKISVVEMMHMEKLAKAILTLGGDPQFSARGMPWYAQNVAYGGGLGEYLHADLAGEYTAIHCYRAHIEAIEDESVRLLLERVIRDEELHVEVFKRLIAKYGL